MEKSYSAKYLKIYFWQILSILLNLLSLFIVIPQLTLKPEVYGVYSVCISSLIFLSYADLGFLSAGYKYASEYYVQNKKKEELEVIGFVCFILFCVVIVFSAILLVFFSHPEWLIKDIPSGNDLSIARSLLLILSLSSPLVVLQRALQVIFGIRLEDYIYQKVLVLVSVLKIVSVFYFFRSEHYEIVAYFLFCQVATFIGLLAAFYMSKRLYSVSIIDFIKCVRFSRKVYTKIKALAFSTLFVTISWILYYELDIYVIARLSGAEAVAYYSVGLTCLSFFRSIFGTLFNPFNARFNYFIAADDEEGLKNLFKMVICVMLPAIVFPILSVVFLTKQLVFTWVGEGFQNSEILIQFLVLSNIMGFISYPSGILIMAKKKIRMMYFMAGIQPVIYWLGIAITYPHFGYVVFSWFTLLSFLINGCMYTSFSLKFINEKVISFFKQFITPALLPVVILIFVTCAIRPYLPLEKNKINLLMVIGAGGFATICAFAVYLFTSKIFKTFALSLFSKLSIKTE